MSGGALRLGKRKYSARSRPLGRGMNDARQANAVCARRQRNTRHLRRAETGPISLSAERPSPARRSRGAAQASRRSPCRRQRLAWVSLSWAKRAGRGPAPRPPRSVPARPICLSRRRGAAAVPGPGDASLSRCDRREDCETGRAPPRCGSHALACVIGVGKILSILQQTHAQQRDRVCNDCEDCTGCRVICGSHYGGYASCAWHSNDARTRVVQLFSAAAGSRS